jgi:hypothetical protein
VWGRQPNGNSVSDRKFPRRRVQFNPFYQRRQHAPNLSLCSLHVASSFGAIPGWGEIQTIDEANDRFDSNRRRTET